jgi:acyl-CoA reductase-like NAD-dependent aldehyde dehydrogenase
MIYPICTIITLFFAFSIAPTWALDCNTVPLEPLLEKSQLKLEVQEQADLPFGHKYLFRSTDNTVAGYAVLSRKAGSTAMIELKAPPASGGIKPEQLLQALLCRLEQDAGRLGYQNLQIANFQKWKKGAQALQGLSFFPEKKSQETEVLTLLSKALKVISIAETHTESAEKLKFFQNVAKILESQRPEVEKILSEINTPAGSRFEINQVLDALNNIETIELHNLQSSQLLNHTAVYSSTNVPLYSLVIQGLIPLSISKNVWFRTAQTTRSVYQKLFDLLQRELPPDGLNGFHLLTAASEVQYDDFRNTYILGLNQGGKFVRDPAEMTIFTGSPETGKKIVAQISGKLNQLNVGSRTTKQVFLGFGAGINPMIITSSAKSRINRAVKATLENISINSSQDCSVPNFYAVEENVSELYLSKLLEKITAMKEGKSTDAAAGYSPLTMTKDFEKLVNYRKKYAHYLITPKAILDPAKKIVSPHVFVFPYSMFKDVELQEHFAPFITVFKYSSETALATIARDERVRNQAMFATIFGGDAASAELSDAINLFQRNGHDVWVNRNLYSPESSNMPFGGSGVETSFVYTFTKHADSPVEITRGHYPTLFSQEVSYHFPKAKNEYPHKNLKPHAYYVGKLDQAAQDSHKAPQTLHNSWKDLQAPNYNFRPNGLQVIRAASQRGFSIVLDERAGTKANTIEAEQWWGVPILFAKDITTPLHTPGVLLHPGSVGGGVHSFNVAQGEINPQEGFGIIHGILEANKLLEYQMAEAISPGIMPQTYEFRDLVDTQTIEPRLLETRQLLIHQFNESLKAGKLLSSPQRKELKRALRELIQSLFAQTRKSFPEGAYFKNFGEFATGDFGTQVTTFSTSYKGISDQFLRRFEAALESPDRPQSLNDPSYFKVMENDPWEMGTKFIYKFLTHADDMQIQERVRVARTPFGYPKEFRVDFVDGEAVLSRPRFTNEYSPQEIEKSKNLVTDFFAKAPPELKLTSGGADVAFLTDGRMILFEFNFGNASGTLHPGYYPIESQLFFSELKGEPTPYIKQLREIFHQGVAAQQHYLKSLKYERALDWRTGRKDLSVEDIGRYFRDLYLQKWSEAGSHPDEGNKVLAEIDQLFAGYESDPIRRLKEGAVQYIKNGER